MKLVIIGATGRTGQLVVAQAIARRHLVLLSFAMLEHSMLTTS